MMDAIGSGSVPTVANVSTLPKLHRQHLGQGAGHRAAVRQKRIELWNLTKILKQLKQLDRLLSASFVVRTDAKNARPDSTLATVKAKLRARNDMFESLPYREPFMLFTGHADGLPASLLRPGRDDKGIASGHFRAHDCTPDAALRFSGAGRPTKRRTLIGVAFLQYRMTGTDTHTKRIVLGIRSDKTRVLGKRVTVFESRKERRKAARAFAAGEWNKMKAVA